jgi:hypothetical protein
MLELNGKPFKCYHILNWFFLPKPGFLGILLNPAHQDLSNNNKGTFQLLRNFQLWFNLIFSEEITQYSRTSPPQAHAPLLVESIPRRPRTRSEASRFGGSHKLQKKLPPFKNRFAMVVIGCLLSHSFRTVILAWISIFVIFAVCSQQPWTSHVCHFDSCSTNYLQWRQLCSWYVGEIECMIQLQPLVQYEVIHICLEHPGISSQHNMDCIPRLGSWL